MVVQEKEDFSSFRRWLFSLTRTELLSAMEFQFRPSVSNESSSHEYDLLGDMVELQSPPPTPVHPRAMGYRPMSRFGPQLDYGADKLRRTQPRLFQWSERRSCQPRGLRKKVKPESRFDVVARKKVAPWGEVYSLGCTRDQQDADDAIVQGTFLRVSHTTISTTQQQQQHNHSASFQDVRSVQYILRTLHIASRGNFLRIPPKCPISLFYAQWLQPTERWFSLSFYLASRYQVSLWDSYCSSRNASSKNASPAAIHYDNSILKLAVPAALSTGLQQAMEDDKGKTEFLRDSIVWTMLSTELGMGKSKGEGEHEDWEAIWNYWKQTPLGEIRRPSSRLRLLVSTSLEQSLVQEMEKNMIMNTEHEQHTQVGRRPKKKKKKKRRRGQDKRAPTAMEGEKECSSSEDEHMPACIRATTSVHFIDNETPQRDRNRNIIAALTIIDDIVEAVFLEVGLEPTLPFESDAKKIHDRREREKKASNGVILVKKIVKGKHKRGSRTEDMYLDDKSSRLKSQALGGKAADAFQPNSVIPLHENRKAQDDTTNRRWPWGASIEFGRTPGGPMPDVAQTENTFPKDFYRPIFPSGLSSGTAADDDDLDGWPFVNRYQSRERSILTDFFRLQEERFDEDEKLMAASTAASIASSTYKDATVVAEADDLEKTGSGEPAVYPEMNTIKEDENGRKREVAVLVDDVKPCSVSPPDGSERSKSPNSDTPVVFAGDVDVDADVDVDTEKNTTDTKLNAEAISSLDTPTESPPSTPDCRSPSPQAPVTPPPTLSPILVSLADLRDLKRVSLTRVSLTPERIARSEGRTKSRSYSSAATPGSLPSSPVPPQKNGLTPSWSREDLRIASFRDDHRIKHKRQQFQPQRLSDQQTTYRSVAVKSLAKPIASSKASNLGFRSHMLDSSLSRRDQRESCARSETAVEGRREDQHWHPDTRKTPQEDIDNKSAAKDECTTITSALSHREPEEISSIREERNAFRDMCLTLGAEVAKLKAILAAQQATADYQETFSHPVYGPGSFDPNAMPPFFHGMQRGQRFGAMSDAGMHRGGDHESQVSEDEVYDAMSKARVDTVRRMSSSATMAGSDVSIEFNNSNGALQGGPIPATPVHDSVPVHGMQSRLTKDILKFLTTTSAQLGKLNNKRRIAIERFARLVHTIWPRAQIKLYGSHVSGLCLPSSDLDFVICLPAVHKRAPALAPGVLEGRNAINETSQRVLARALKGESWIDPRSIKLIERTVVPVIKVSTKDTRARIIQLDISFDSPEHHGLEANEMVPQIVDELPLIRPLMLVLKQFLLDRGLLTAYTGGLSSYCLFLMLARYLQEQPHTVGDCGSLLMGFLDFHGNYFDPRATAISVRRRQYFVRPNYAVASYQATAQPHWTPHQPQPPHMNSSSPSSASQPEFLRRNSFSDTGSQSVDGARRNPPTSLQRPPRFQPSASSSHRYVPHNVHTNGTSSSFGHGRPFTFDPLFVEDPLSAGNNVGRNAFRIFQVQRAFSDAHRALVASLEWDIHSSGELNDGVDYPLLKCLLQSEDVLYEL